MSACVPTTTSAWPDAIASCALALTSALSDPVSSVTPIPTPSSSAPTVSRCWRASRSVGASRAPWSPARAVAASAYAATAVLPEPTSPWRSRSIGVGRARSSRMAAIAESWSTVRSIGCPILRPDRVDERRPDALVESGIQGHDRGGVADPLAPPLDHAELEGEQLVEGEALERRIASLEGLRVVGLLDGARDRHEPLLRHDRRGQVLRVGVPGLVERLADRRPQARRRQTGGQRVDRHDPARVEHLVPSGQHLELWVVERQLATEVLDLPRDDDLAADRQAALDEAPPEPGRVDAAGIVLEPRDRALDPAAEPGLDAHVADRRLDRYDRAVLLHVQVADDPHLAQVVVAPRQVEEQVADRVEVEPDAGPTQLVGRRKPGPRQRRVEQLDRVGRRGRKGRGRGLPRRRGPCHRPPYSAEIRYR